MDKIPELLAPAGGMPQLKAAVENGADAVYMGGRLFNARINAANFDDEEMKEAISYARLRGVKLYAAMNTLIKDSELADALNYAASLYEWGADALIIQDLGFASLVRKQIPDFAIHLSTQGTVYNLQGVKKAGELGFSRVVLARELSLAEIREITAANLAEVEVFVHGALCICYSGQCQMSREIGGRSGNRGECAQPCRLPYSVCRSRQGDVSSSLGESAGPPSMREVAGPSFALSPRDLCTVEQLALLSEAGVASLKIEGRMKAPEYVAVVTGIYRKYLDLYAKHGQYRVDPADLQDLNQIFNRGGFTEGYLLENPGKNLMSGNLSKHQGVYIGKVTGSSGGDISRSALQSPGPPKAAARGKSSTRQKGLVTIRLAGKLSLGDGIEIRSRDLPGNLVTYMRCGEKRVECAEKGALVTVGYLDGKVSPGDLVYKITDKALMERARASYEGKSGSAEKVLRKTGVSFHFRAGLDRPASLSAVDEDGNRAEKRLPHKAEKALARALTGDGVKAQLEKTGGTAFQITECIVELEEGISLPLSKINELRRGVLDELALLRKKGREPVVINWSLSQINRKAGAAPGQAVSVQAALEEELFLYLYRVREEEPVSPDFSRIYIPYDAILKGFYRGDERAVPVIPNITKGWHDQNIWKNFDRIAEASAGKGVAVGNLGWIAPFADAGVKVLGDYGLNLYNSADFFLARELGIQEAVISHECDLREMIGMDFHGVTPEAAAGGRIPVMISEHCLFAPSSAWPGKTDSSERSESEDEGRCLAGDLDLCGSHSCSRQGEQGEFFLKDRRGQTYPILTDPADCRSLILSSKNANLLIQKETLKKAGIKRFRIYAE